MRRCVQRRAASWPRHANTPHREGENRNMLDDIGVLLWGLLFSSIGLGFFIYGKKQSAAVPLLTGVALMVFPYFVAIVYLLVAIGVALIALPYFVRLSSGRLHVIAGAVSAGIAHLIFRLRPLCCLGSMRSTPAAVPFQDARARSCFAPKPIVFFNRDKE